MAADFKLNIPITADGRSAVSNLNETADSASKLFKDLVKGTATVKEFDAAMGEDLAVAARKAGEGFKVIEAQYKTIIPLFEKARQKFSENANATEDQKQAFRDLEATYKILKEEVDKKRAADDAEAEAVRKRNEELKKQAEEDQRIIDYLHEMAEAQDEYNARLKEQAGLSARINANYDNYINGRISSASAGAAAMPGSIAFNDANLRFYRQVGDEVAYAHEELRLYEEQLRRVLAAENASPAAIDSATQSYLRQREVVESLTVTKNSHLMKLISVAKNILKFQLLMGPITSAIRGVKQTISDSIKVAAEAQQVFNKLATVFEGVENAASSMARTLSSALGVANSTAASALSTVGDLLQAQGMGISDSLAQASKWVKQFQDIIAFKDLNMSLEEFAQNFMSGAAGNLRNFRTFGSIVKESAVNARLAAEGLDKLTGSQLELAKMTIRANMALEQQANAIGATEREWNTTLSINRRWNEELKTTKELLGDAINAQLDKVKKKATEVLSRFNNMQKLLKAMQNGDIATEAWSATAENKQAMTDAMDANFDKALRKSIGAALSAALGTALGIAVTAGTAGVGAGIAGAGAFTNAASEISKAASAWADMIPSVEELLQLAATTGADMEQVESTLRDNAKIYNSIFTKGTKYADQLDKNIAEAKKLYKDQKATEKARIAMLSKLEGVADEYAALIDAINLITGATAADRDIYSANMGNYATSSNATYWIVNQMAGLTSEAIREGFESLMGSEDSVFGDTIEYFLDNLTRTDLLKSKQDSLRSLFEVAWNEFWKDGVLALEENNLLNLMKDGYQEIGDAIDDINTALERQKNLESSIAQLRESTTSYQVMLATEQTRADYGSRDSQWVSLELARSSAIASGEEQKANILSLLGLNAEDLPEISELLAKVAPLLQFKKLGSDYYNYYESDSSPISADVLNADQDLYEKYGIFIRETSEEVDNLLLFISTFDEYMESVKDYYDYMEEERQKELKANYLNANDRVNDFIAQTSLRLGKEMSPGLSDYANARYAPVAGLGRNESVQSQINELWDELTVLIENMREAGEAAGVWSEELESQTMTGAINNMKSFAQHLNEIDASEALKAIAEAWKAIGDRALSGTGTLGGVFQSFKGDGDIWTKILNAILTILENTEGWSELAATINQIFEMFEPVMDAIMDLIVSLPWDIIIFCLKVIASVIVVVAKAVEAIVDTLQWLWYNIKMLFSGQWGKMMGFAEYMETSGANDRLAKISSQLEKIWDTEYSIRRKMDDDKDLKVLEDLWRRRIIDTQTYYKEAGSLQGYYQADPMEAALPSYVSSGSRYASVTYGNVTIAINGGNLDEVEKVVYRVLSKSDVPYDMPLASGGY